MESQIPEQHAIGYKNPPLHTRWQSGTSPNPGGTRRGFVYPSAAYARLGSLSLEQIRDYEPANVIEAGIKNTLLRAAEAKSWKAAQAAIKEIADRVEGKAVTRKIDLGAEDVVSKARLLYQMGLRLREQITQHCETIACDDACKHRMLALIPPDEQGVLEAVLATVEERYHEAVIRELGEG